MCYYTQNQFFNEIQGSLGRGTYYALDGLQRGLLAEAERRERL